MASKNMWGDLSKLEVARSPKAILQEQGDYLTKATGGVLVGTIGARVVASGFAYDLDVEIPALNNYRYTILTIEHDATLYPVTVRAERPTESYQCEDEEEFETVIESILGSEDVQLILSRLLSQAT